MLVLASMLALSPSALAQDTAAAPATMDCALATLSQSLPADGATNVPFDVAPVLLFEGTCGVPAPYTVSLYRAGETDPARTDVYDFAAFQTAGAATLLELDVGSLDEDTAYTLELSTDFGDVETIAFETGSSATPTISGAAPAIAIDDATQSQFEQGWSEIRVDLTLTSAADDPSLSTYIVRSGGFERTVLLATGASDTTSLAWGVDDPLDEVCVTAIERDGTGSWHGPSEEVCADLDTGSSGCSASGVAPSALSLLAGLLLPLARRRD